MMKKYYKVLLIIIGLFLTFIGLMVRGSKTCEADTYFVNGEKEKLNSGEKLQIAVWDPGYKNVTLYNGIKIGSSKEKVVQKFNLNSNNTQYNCEVDGESGDGTTKVKVGRFTKSIFKSDYLDCYLIFGYKNGKMLNYSEIDYIEKNPKKASGVIKYSIGIEGFIGENIGEGKVENFIVTRY